MMANYILIPGANGRIGLNSVKNFLKKGYYVIAVDKDISKLKKINSKLLITYKIDLSREANIKKLFKKISSYKNKINGILYCLYPKTKHWGKKFEDLDEKILGENLYLQIGLNIIFLKYLYQFLRNTKRKVSIILMSSIQGVRPPKFEHYRGLKMSSPIEYTASKAGIISITSYLAKYFKNKKNLRINCISPGGIKDNQNKIFLQRYKKSSISKGLLNPEDIFGLIEFLLSVSSEYIKGQNFVIDDGWSL